MSDKEKELLLKDLCARLSYEVKGLHRGEIQRLLIMDSFGSYQVNGYAAWFNLDIVPFKPYLRPMSSMTEEEKEEYDKTFDWDYSIQGTPFDWLNMHHFDFRGLIERGLALEAPENMYKNE